MQQKNNSSEYLIFLNVEFMVNMDIVKLVYLHLQKRMMMFIIVLHFMDMLKFLTQIINP